MASSDNINEYRDTFRGNDPREQSEQSEPKRKSRTVTSRSSGKSSKSSSKSKIIEKLLNNPAVVGTLTTALVSALVTAGLDPEAAQTWGDYIMYGLVLLFVGGSAGVAVRAQVKPVRKD